MAMRVSDEYLGIICGVIMNLYPFGCLLADDAAASFHRQAKLMIAGRLMNWLEAVVSHLKRSFSLTILIISPPPFLSLQTEVVRIFVRSWERTQWTGPTPITNN